MTSLCPSGSRKISAELFPVVSLLSVQFTVIWLLLPRIKAIVGFKGWRTESMGFIISNVCSVTLISWKMKTLNTYNSSITSYKNHKRCVSFQKSVNTFSICQTRVPNTKWRKSGLNLYATQDSWWFIWHIHSILAELISSPCVEKIYVPAPLQCSISWSIFPPPKPHASSNSLYIIIWATCALRLLLLDLEITIVNDNNTCNKKPKNKDKNKVLFQLDSATLLTTHSILSQSRPKVRRMRQIKFYLQKW